MRLIGNVLWLVLAGLWLSLGWFLVGVLWCITIVGIPVGRQCLKLSRLMLAPFGKRIEYRGSGVSVLLNLVWMIFGGFALALEALLFGCLLCMTLVGIPFGLQCFKFARLALTPFGSRVENNIW